MACIMSLAMAVFIMVRAGARHGQGLLLGGALAGDFGLLLAVAAIALTWFALRHSDPIDKARGRRIGHLSRADRRFGTTSRGGDAIADPRSATATDISSRRADSAACVGHWRGSSSTVTSAVLKWATGAPTLKREGAPSRTERLR
jgi:hypothetical protein